MTYPVELIRPELLAPAQTFKRPSFSFGSYTPSNELTNQEITSWKLKDTLGKDIDDAWIKKRVGALTRPTVLYETAEYMAYRAAQRALLGAKDKRVDVVVVSTSHPTGRNIATYIAESLNLNPHTVLDVYGACTGAMYGIYHLNQIGGFEGQRILLIATEIYSDKVKHLTENQQADGSFYDPSFAQTIFADGSEAIFGKGGENMILRAAKYKKLDPKHDHHIEMAIDPELMADPYIKIDVPQAPAFRQKGYEVLTAVEENIPPLSMEAREEAGITNPKVVSFHQGSLKMDERLARKEEYAKDVIAVDTKKGNFSSASTLRTLRKLVSQGIVEKGDTVELTAFGAGMSGCSVIMELAA